MIQKGIAQTHNEECRKRMEPRVETTNEGKERKRKAVDKETEWLAEKVKRGETEVDQGSKRKGNEEEADDSRKVTRISEEERIRVHEEREERKRCREDQHREEEEKRRRNNEVQGMKRDRGEKAHEPDTAGEGSKRERGERCPDSEAVDIQIDQEVYDGNISSSIDESPFRTDITEMVSSYQDQFLGSFSSQPEPYLYDPYEWEVSMGEDMCQKEQFGDIDYDKVYYDETFWETLDPRLRREGGD